MIPILKADLLKSMKAQDQTKVIVLRRIIAEMQTIEANGTSPTEQNCINAIKKAIKQNEDEITIREKARKYEEAVNTLKKEILILQSYLPSFLTKERIREILCMPENLIQIKQAKNSGAAVGVAMKILRTYGAVEGLTVKETTEEIYNDK